MIKISSLTRRTGSTPTFSIPEEINLAPPIFLHFRRRLLRIFGPAVVILTAACGNDIRGTPQPTAVVSVEVIAVSNQLSAFDETLQPTAIARDASGGVVYGVSFAWASSAPNVILVDSTTGLTTSIGNGIGQINATADGVTGSLSITVEQAVSSIRLSPDPWEARWDSDRVQASAEGRDANDYLIDADFDWSWSSSNTDLVRVDDVGVITAISPGTAQVSATFDSVSGSIDANIPGTPADSQEAALTVWPGRSDRGPAVLVDGSLSVKNGIYVSPIPEFPAPNGGWVRPNVAKFQWWGDRAALLTDVVNGTGNLYARDWTGGWLRLVNSDAVDFEVEGASLGVLFVGGRFEMKASLEGPWIDEVAEGVVDFDLESNRIVVLLEDGSVSGKDNMFGVWRTLASRGVAEIVLEGNRIGLLSETGSVVVRDGIDGTPVEIVSGGAVKLAMGANIIAVLFDDGHVVAKDGIFGTPRQLATRSIVDVAVENLPDAEYRIGLLRDDGLLLAKDHIDNDWAEISGAVTEFQLQRNFIGALQGRTLRVKFGLAAEWTNWEPPGSAPVSQFRPVIDVAHIPNTTTQAGYLAKLPRCISDADGAVCYDELGDQIPAPFYGRYCGAFRPENQEAADLPENRELDSLDWICKHHDNGGNWYEAYRDAGDLAQACIVHFGLLNARIRRGNRVLTTGSDFYNAQARWNAAWANIGMPKFRNGIEGYLEATSGCDMDYFIQQMSGKNH